MITAELVTRLIIELLWIYASIFGIRSTKLQYWKQCWYIILLGSIIHMGYIFAAYNTYGIYICRLCRYF